MKQIDIRSIVLSLLILPVFMTSALPATAGDKRTPAVQETLIELQPTQAPTLKTIGVLIFPGF